MAEDLDPTICRQVLCAQTIMMDYRPLTSRNIHYCHRLNNHTGNHCAAVTDDNANVQLQWNDTGYTERHGNTHTTCP